MAAALLGEYSASGNLQRKSQRLVLKGQQRSRICRFSLSFGGKGPARDNHRPWLIPGSVVRVLGFIVLRSCSAGQHGSDALRVGYQLPGGG